MKKCLMLFLIPALVFAILDTKWVDINRWRCAINNYGGFGGGYWPFPYQNYYIFGAGFWLGWAPSDTITTLGYNPNTGGREVVPTLCWYWREGYTNSLDRVYKYPGDWPAPLSRFPMAPQINLSNMDLWCCFCDSDPSWHATGGRPIGIDIALTTYGFSDSLAQDFFFMKYDIINNNAYSINNLYFGIILDADIGNANDDMVGLLRDRNFTIGTQIIRVKNTGYVYDYDNNEPPGQYWQSGTPGAVAIRLLQAPPGLAMTAFKKFTLDFDPIYDRDQYLTLAGYNYQTGAYEPFDSIDLIPGDKRFLLASGPFNLNAFSTVSFHYAVIGAQYGEAGALPNNRDTTQLAWQSYLADSIYQARIINVGIAEKLSAYDNQSITIYPNPVRTYLNIKSKQGGQLTVEIYNVNGALVNLLTGNDRLQWDGTDNRQQKLPNGIYFVKVISENQTGLSKVLLLR